MPSRFLIFQFTFMACAIALAFDVSAFEQGAASPVMISDTSHDMHAKHAENEMMVGDLMLKGAFARATLPNQPVAGAYLTVVNIGDEDDVLLSVTSAIAERGEVHEMAMSGDTMRMRKLDDGLPIPAGAVIELKPGGYHLMFRRLAGPLVEGEAFEATLEFEKAGEISVTFSVMSKGAKTMDHSGHGS